MAIRERRLLLGIDGGGSSTSALLAHSDAQGWSALGRGEAGPSNLAVGPPDAALANLTAAMRAAFEQACLPPQSVSHACFALAGSDRASVRETLAQWLATRSIANSWTLVHDAQPLLAWASPSETAIALIGGTGSMAWGRNPGGQAARAGGWGPLLGDEGSGYWIGLQALRAVVQQADHQACPTQLTATLPAEWQCDDLRQLPLLVQARGRDEIAALAPWVGAAADAGDVAAGQILSDAADHFIRLVLAVARALGVSGGLDRLAYTGGVLLHRPQLLELVVSGLRQQRLAVHQIDRVTDSTRGAVELAHRATSH